MLHTCDLSRDDDGTVVTPQHTVTKPLGQEFPTPAQPSLKSLWSRRETMIA